MMNHIISSWKKDMKRGVMCGIFLTVMLSLMVWVLTVFSVWCALLLLLILPYGVFSIVEVISEYRRKMSVWQSLSDADRRTVNELCADERQKAYSRLLRGYLTPIGMMLPCGFLPWERITSINFREKGRDVSRGAIAVNFLSAVLDFFSLFTEGGLVGEYTDPESPACCRIRVKREGKKQRIVEYTIPLDPQSFAGDGVDRLIVELKEASPVPLNIT